MPVDIMEPSPQSTWDAYFQISFSQETKMNSYHVHALPVQIFYDMQVNSISTFTAMIGSGNLIKSGA